MPAENIYECPNGCKHKDGGPIAASVRGWKKHMTRQHQGWQQSQLDTLLGVSTGNTEAGRSLFLAEADSDPATAAETAEAGGPIPIDSARPAVDLKTEATSKKLTAKMNKFKRQIAEQIPKAINGLIKDKGPEWQLDKDDTDMLAEQVENAMDVLDVDFKIQPIGMTLENPLWVLLLPILALLLIFGTKAVKNAPAKSDEQPAE